MKDHKKLGSRSSSPTTEALESTGAAVFGSSSEGEPVLMVEGISRTTCESASNSGTVAGRNLMPDTDTVIEAGLSVDVANVATENPGSVEPVSREKLSAYILPVKQTTFSADAGQRINEGANSNAVSNLFVRTEDVIKSVAGAGCDVVERPSTGPLTADLMGGGDAVPPRGAAHSTDLASYDKFPTDTISGTMENGQLGLDAQTNDSSDDDDDDLSMTDSADRLSYPTRKGTKRLGEELHRTSKRRDIETEDASEEENTARLSPRDMTRVEGIPNGQGEVVEIKVSTRRKFGSSASKLEGPNAKAEKTAPEFHASKSESLDSSDKKAPTVGGGLNLIGRKTRKDFGGQFYTGKVVWYDPKAKYYKVQYEDEDEEELEWSELEPTLVLTEQKPLSFKSMIRARNLAARPPHRTKVRHKYAPNKSCTFKVKKAVNHYEGGVALSEQQKAARNIARMWKSIQAVSASVLEEGNEDSLWKGYSSGVPLPLPPQPPATSRFASAGDADVYEYFGWGEVMGFDKAKCPELRAAKLLPTSSPIVHLSASQHHLAAITSVGQVWLWRNNHGNIHTRCNEWEHVASLEDKGVVLVDIAGPDLDRTSGGYEADQEDQVPDPFYLVAVSANGEDFIVQGSQPQENLGLKDVLSHLGHLPLDSVGQIVQVSVGTVEAPDESPFIGVYHAIIMTDDGRAWTWGRGYYHGLSSLSSSGFSTATCQPAVGTLVGRKVIDIGCYGEDFIALTSDGDVHQWTHAVPNPAAGVYNVPATPLYGQGPCITNGDKLKQVSIGASMCAGITESGRVHSWRTAMKGGLVGVSVTEKEALTPLGHEESNKDTMIASLGLWPL